MTNLTNSKSNNNSQPDFYIENNHARSSIYKASKIIGVNNSSLYRILSAQYDPKSAIIFKEQGLGVSELNEIIGYYATSQNSNLHRMWY